MASLQDQHEISNVACDDRIRGFFNGKMPAPYSVLGSVLQQAMSSVPDPFTWEVRLTGDASNHTDNSDLEFSVVEHTAIAAIAENRFSVAYSVALFLELFVSFAPGVTVDFSKATGSASDDDVVFMIRKNESTVYCGDMSQAWP